VEVARSSKTSAHDAISSFWERIMTTNAIFVDLPNLYSHLLESGAGDPRLKRDYFLYWFDFDRLARKLTDRYSSVWIFYSGRKFGPKENRIEDEFLDKYIDRTNSLRGVTARDVDIEGKQREKAIYKCDKCGNQGVAQWESEKGIDASLTVHLFDTMEAWDVAYLLSGDADFAPVVASLRRRGKIVIGAGFINRSTALVRECYNYIDLWKLFFQEDIFAYCLFAEDGFAKKWLTDEVRPQSDNGPIALTFEWQVHDNRVLIYLTAKGDINLENRLNQLENLRNIFPDGIGELNPKEGTYQLILTNSRLDNTIWGGVERRIDKLISSLQGLEIYKARISGTGFSAQYEYNANTKKYGSSGFNGKPGQKRPGHANGIA
jgi:uncharacterized LabA/DUF88 family protein